MTAARPTVGLFVTCLVDIFRPVVGFAAARLIERAGCAVEVPTAQTCCGQPAYNAGARAPAKALARQFIAQFEAYDYVVAPSGSCAAMVGEHYPALLADDPHWARRASELAARTHELTWFLVEVRGLVEIDAAFAGSIAYHDACAGLRELGIHDQPRALLDRVDGLTRIEAADADTCCGFGGTFCMKHPELAARITENKVAELTATGAGTVVAGDLGCLMNIAGRLRRDGSAVSVRHVAEILAGMCGTAGIGEA